MELFQNCPICHEVCEVDMRKREGTSINVHQSCKFCGHQRIWESQPFIGRIPAGNLLLSAAILYATPMFSKVQRMFQFMNVLCISKTTYYDHQKRFVAPQVFRTWETQQQEILSQIKIQYNGQVVAAADGRSDSPGHSAKYGSVTLMDPRFNKVIDIQTVQVCIFIDLTLISFKVFFI